MLESLLSNGVLDTDLVSFDAMPEEVQTMARKGVGHWGSDPERFGQPQEVYFEGLDSYVLPVSPNPDYEDTEEVLIVFDTDEEGKVIGRGTVARNASNDPEVVKTPYVYYTETDTKQRGQGLGMRRLHLMNRLSLEYFGATLSSDPTGDTIQEAARLWRRLVDSGEAEEVEHDDTTTYRFIAV